MRANVAVLLLVTVVHAAMWAVFQERPRQAPDFGGTLPSLSYAPSYDVLAVGPGTSDTGKFAAAARIRADMKKLALLTRAIRLYSSTGAMELVPPIAAEFGLKVTVGAWIDKDIERNAHEIDAAIRLARHNPNVIGVIVGNETIYRGEQRASDLIELIKRVKRAVNVPVSTGEIWNIWRDNPLLSTSVDFMAAHILPYWENATDNQAVDKAMDVYQKLRDTFPGKRIVIAEFGWPSAGYGPGPYRQADVLRTFVTRADASGIDYNIVEAIDTPWKAFEGGVGPYWGILDASGEPKFAWAGPIVDENHWKLATAAVLVGILMSLPMLWLGGATVMQALMQATAAHVAGAWGVNVFAYWAGHYFTSGSAFAVTLGLILSVPLLLVAMAPKYFAAWIGRALKTPWRHTSC